MVTMDLTMPEMDGGECVADWCERDPNIRILVISALADKLTAIDAIEKGRQRLSVQALYRPATQRRLRKLIED